MKLPAAHLSLIVAKAREVGGILNGVEDGAEREQLQAQFEQVLNEELARGSDLRRQLASADGLLADIVGITPRLRRAPDPDAAS